MGMLRASELIGAQTKSHSEFLDTMHSRASSIPFEPGRIHSLPRARERRKNYTRSNHHTATLQCSVARLRQTISRRSQQCCRWE